MLRNCSQACLAGASWFLHRIQGSHSGKSKKQRLKVIFHPLSPDSRKVHFWPVNFYSLEWYKILPCLSSEAAQNDPTVVPPNLTHSVILWKYFCTCGSVFQAGLAGVQESHRAGTRAQDSDRDRRVAVLLFKGSKGCVVSHVSVVCVCLWAMCLSIATVWTWKRGNWSHLHWHPDL